MIQKLRKAAEKAEIKANKINTEVTGNWTHRKMPILLKQKMKRE